MFFGVWFLVVSGCLFPAVQLGTDSGKVSARGRPRYDAGFLESRPPGLDLLRVSARRGVVDARSGTDVKC